MMMRAIEATILVDDDGAARLCKPLGLTPGEHRVVLVVEEAPSRRDGGVGFGRYDVGLVDPTMTFRREDLYGDDGR